MAEQIIDVGTAPNNGTGDPLRTAFIKTDNNFDQIWAAGPVGSNVRIQNNVVSTLQVNQDLALSPNGVGNVRLNNNTIPGANNTWFLGSTTNQWRGVYANSITAGNVTINNNLVVPGDVTIEGNLTVEGDTIQIGNIVTDTKTIQLSNTASTANAATGSGITVGANDNIATLLYNSASNVWITNIGVTATGNITAPYFIGNGALLTGITSYSNTNATSLLASFGSNTISTTGNITAGYFIGNGSQLTGITSYANANAVAYGEAGWAGNIIPSDNAVYSLGNATNQWNDLYVSNATIFMNNVPISLSAGNVLTVNGNAVLQNNSNSTISTTGNITAGNIGITGGSLTWANASIVQTSASDVSITGDGQVTVRSLSGTYQWTFDSNGNLILPGSIISASTIELDNRAYGNSADINLYAADDITLQARDRTLGSTSEGGDINIFAGDSAEDSDSSGGDVQIRAGDGGAANVDFGGSGGFITIQSGQGGAAIGNSGYTAESGGALTLGAGDAGSNNGNIDLGAAGGDVYIGAGDSTGNTADGGGIYITSGAAGTNALAGQIQLTIPPSDSGSGGVWIFDGYGNLTAPGNVSASGNISGAYVKGNGSELTNLPAPTVTQDISSTGAMSIMTYDGVIKYVNYATVEPSSGNITGGNISTTGNVTAGNIITGGLISATGNITAGNLTVGSGTVNGGNFNGANFNGNVAFGTGTVGGSGNITGGNISAIGNISGGNLSVTGNITAANFFGNGATLSNVATQVISSWTVPVGNSTQSFTVPINNTYQLWVLGNIPNGIIVYNATVSVSNTNVPVIGQQFAWNYEGGGNILMFTSIPAQIVGTAGTISNAAPAVANTNVFSFGINNTSGNTVTVNYGYTKIS